MFPNVADIPDLPEEAVFDSLFGVEAMGLWFKLGKPTAIPQGDDPEALVLRGYCHLTGIGNSVVDPKRARRCFQKAEALGSVQASEALCGLLMLDDPIGPATREAARRAAERGNPQKLIMLLLTHGTLTKDEGPVREAEKLVGQMGRANGLDTWALSRSMKGLGIAAARHWAELALKEGSPEAHADVAEYLDAEGKSAEAEALRRAGADLGDSHCAGQLLRQWMEKAPHVDTESLIPRYAEIAVSDADPFYTVFYAMSLVEGRGRPADPKAGIAPLALACLSSAELHSSFRHLALELIDQHYFHPEGRGRVPARILTEWLFPRLAAKFSKTSYLHYLPFLKLFAFKPTAEHPRNLDTTRLA
jgi:hypothetical protein